MHHDWLIVNSNTARPLNNLLYESEKVAGEVLTRLGDTFSRLYTVIPFYDNQKWNSVILEGFKQGDLEGILLPQFSIDVYVPSDAKTDHIVVGFLIKGVPEAVFPFKKFCEFSHGVKKVDYGDSDTLPHTSLVYVEFDREKFDPNDLFSLVDNICRLSSLKPDDLSVNFPNTNDSFPYTERRIKAYFGSRDRSKNRLAQYKASQERNKQIQKELEDEIQNGDIGKRLGGSGIPQPATGGGVVNHGHSLRRLQHPTKAVGQKDKPKTDIEVPETIKASIIADAKRNRVNHQVQWKDFDTRWAQRLHVTPNKVASIRKAIYDRP